MQILHYEQIEEFQLIQDKSVRITRHLKEYQVELEKNGELWQDWREWEEFMEDSYQIQKSWDRYMVSIHKLGKMRILYNDLVIQLDEAIKKEKESPKYCMNYKI